MTEINGTKITIEAGDITEVEVDAIAHGVNNHLWMGSGVAGAIRRKGGIAIVKEALEHGPIQMGEAIVTAAGNLKAHHVIHAAVMGRDLTAGAEHVGKAMESTLQRAREIGAKRLALAAFGTGVGGFPVEQSAAIMLERVSEYLDRNPGAFSDIVFVLLHEEEAEIFKKVLHGSRN